MRSSPTPMPPAASTGTNRPWTILSFATIHSILIAACLCLRLTTCAADTASSPLIQPWVVSSADAVWNATLAVRAAGYDDGVSRFISRQYCLVNEAVPHDSDAASVRCGFPGPTLLFKAGDRVSLTVRNELDHDPLLDHPPPATLLPGAKPWHHPNITNLHTHGLHVSTLVDSVFVRIAPGGEHTYHYRIPSEHAPGIGLYHAHTHGTVSLQMAGGLHGAFVVVPSRSGSSRSPSPPLPTPYTALPDPLLLVFSHIQLTPERVEHDAITQDCTFNLDAPYDMFKSHSYAQLSREVNDRLFDFGEVGRHFVADLADASNELMWFSRQHEGESFRRGNYYVVNGQLQPTLSLVAHRWTILQLIHAAGARTLDLEAPASCDMEVLAVDGVFLDHVAPRRRLHLLPAGRYEVQLRCAKTGTHPLVGAFFRYRQTLLTLQVADPPTPTTTNDTSPPPPAVTTADLASLRRPAYLTDLTRSEPLQRFSVSFAFPEVGVCPDKARLIGAGRDCGAVWRGELPSSTEWNIPDPSGAWTNHSVPSSLVVPNPCRFREWTGHSQWDNMSRVEMWNATWLADSFIAPTGSLAEWRIYGMMTRSPNDTSIMNFTMEMPSSNETSEVPEFHPFHVHAHHVQVVAFTPTFESEPLDLDEHFLAPGTWRDTFAALDGELLVRFRVIDEPGEVVFHCHTTRHEDHGMMASFYVCDDQVDGACPAGLVASSLAVAQTQPSLFVPFVGVLLIVALALLGCLYSSSCRHVRDGWTPVSSHGEHWHPHPASVASTGEDETHHLRQDTRYLQSDRASTEE